MRLCKRHYLFRVRPQASVPYLNTYGQRLSCRCKRKIQSVSSCNVFHCFRCKGMSNFPNMQEFCQKNFDIIFLMLTHNSRCGQNKFGIVGKNTLLCATKPIDYETHFHTWNEGGSIRRTYLSGIPLGTPGRGRLSAPSVQALELGISPIHTHIGA